MDENKTKFENNSQTAPTDTPEVSNTTDTTTGTQGVSEAPAETTSESAAAPVPEAAVGGEVTQKKMGVGSMIAIAVAVLVVVGAIVWTVMKDDAPSQDIDIALPGETAAPMDFSGVPDVVATINGIEIDKAAYEEAYAQAANIAAQQGVDPNNPSVQAQIETQALERLVNTEVLAQAAADVAVSAEDVSAELANLEANFGGAEALSEELEAAGISAEELESDIRSQLQIDALIQASPEWAQEFTITEEEKQALYDEVAAQSPEVPDFAEVEAQIEQQLLSQKQQEATEALIDRLLETASVTTYLDEEAE